MKSIEPLEVLDTLGPGGVTIRIGKPGYKAYVEQEHYLGGPFVIASVRVENEKYESIEDQTRCYAALFAAAPDLLEALKAMKRAVEQLMPGIGHIACQDYANINEAPILANRAIAKAEGRRK